MILPQSINQYVPEWFSLDKYDPCATMNLDAWRNAVRDREKIYSALSIGANAYWSNGFSRRIEVLFRDAVSKLGAVFVAQPKSYPGSFVALSDVPNPDIEQ